MRLAALDSGGLIAACIILRNGASPVLPAWGDGYGRHSALLLCSPGEAGLALISRYRERKGGLFWTTFSQRLIYRREPDGRLPFDVEAWQQRRLRLQLTSTHSSMVMKIKSEMAKIPTQFLTPTKIPTPLTLNKKSGATHPATEPRWLACARSW